MKLGLCLGIGGCLSSQRIGLAPLLATFNFSFLFSIELIDNDKFAFSTVNTILGSGSFVILIEIILNIYF